MNQRTARVALITAICGRTGTAGDRTGAKMRIESTGHPSPRTLLALSNAPRGIVASLRRASSRACSAIEQYRRARADQELLEEMGERELRDIGLTRADIPAAVHGRLDRAQSVDLLKVPCHVVRTR